MKNKSVVVLLVLMFALALGAGVVAGKLSTRLPAPSTPTTSRETLIDTLHLTPDQQQKMQAIWQDVRETSNGCLKEANAAQIERDDRLMKILTEDQKAQYKQISEEISAKIAVIDARRRQSFKEAVDKTNLILDEDQRKIYGRIIKDRVGDLPDGA